MRVKVICGTLVVRKERFLLVKEAKKHVYGKWNFPAGHLSVDENIFHAAKREVKEETNLDVKLDGIIGIYQHKGRKGNNIVIIIFKASVIGGKLKHPEEEILDAKWFTFKEFLELKDDEIRGSFMVKALSDFRKRELLNIDSIRVSGF